MRNTEKKIYSSLLLNFVVFFFFILALVSPWELTCSFNLARLVKEEGFLWSSGNNTTDTQMLLW